VDDYYGRFVDLMITDMWWKYVMPMVGCVMVRMVA